MLNQNVPSDKPTLALIDLEKMIHRYVGDIEKLKEEIKDQKDMYDAIFENDGTFQKQKEEEEKLKKIKETSKKQLVKTPAASTIAEKVKEMKDDLKNLQHTLSDLLKQYQKTSGSNLLSRDDGTIFEIITSLKLVKKSSS